MSQFLDGLNMSSRIYIKNMVCPRCILAVRQILKKLNIQYLSVELGKVRLEQEIGPNALKKLKPELEAIGFSLINDRKSRLIEQMKSLVIEKIHHTGSDLNIKWADFISDRLNLDYKYLSSLFSSIESITFEQYIINQKIERVKELIVYDEQSLSEISYKLNYSSVAYLSNQFKKVTGMTPTEFKNSVSRNRKSLDDF